MMPEPISVLQGYLADTGSAANLSFALKPGFCHEVELIFRAQAQRGLLMLEQDQVAQLVGKKLALTPAQAVELLKFCAREAGFL